MSMSKRARRMLQHQLRNRADAELNLIPMIDILSVMVSFLLVYSTEVEVVQNSKGIEIPQSISERKPSETVVVMITRDSLFVDGRLISSLRDVAAMPGTIITPLKEALIAQNDRILNKAQKTDITRREVTIMGDKATPFSMLKRIMATCTEADYGKVSLAVVEREGRAAS